MNKYYTPSIEEFHIGFEYEVQQLIEIYGEISISDDYASFLFDEDDSLKGMNEAISENKIRVKYLNVEDIESLGWKSYSGDRDFELPNREYQLEINIDNSLCITSRYGEVILFKGIIKNKSELKRLMKQLNITL